MTSFAVCYDELDKEVAEVRRHRRKVTLHINCLQLVLAAVAVTADSKLHVPTPSPSSPTWRRVAAGRGARLAPWADAAGAGGRSGERSDKKRQTPNHLCTGRLQEGCGLLVARLPSTFMCHAAAAPLALWADTCLPAAEKVSFNQHLALASGRHAACVPTQM